MADLKVSLTPDGVDFYAEIEWEGLLVTGLLLGGVRGEDEALEKAADWAKTNHVALGALRRKLLAEGRLRSHRLEIGGGEARVVPRREAGVDPEGQRAAEVTELLASANEAMIDGLSSADPVARRRAHVRTAKLLRRAADQLDDHGRLTE